MEIHGIDQYMRYAQKHLGLGEMLESDHIRCAVPREIGDGRFDLFHEKGLFQVWIIHAQSNRDIEMSYVQDENSYIGLSYVETETLQKASKDDQSPEIQTWRTTRSLPSDDMVYGVCKANMPLRAATLILFRDFFVNCLGVTNAQAYFDILNAIRSFDEQTFMHAQYPVLAEMLHCTYQDISRKLFVKSRVYDTAARLIALCDVEREEPNVALSRFDLKQIRSIPHILKDCMVNPPSISTLSRMVTLNEFKLKAGFKKVFNTTIYEYLRQIRIEKAIELIKQDIELGQIAKEVGYVSMRGFSQAFEKRTGVTPAEWRKQRCMKKDI